MDIHAIAVAIWNLIVNVIAKESKMTDDEKATFVARWSK